MCELLEVFDEVTEELSAEKRVTISKILMMIDGIRGHLFTMKNDKENMRFTYLLKMINILEEKFSSRAIKYENSAIIAEATFLDPRFKKYGFPSSTHFDRTETAITNLAGKLLD